jgi:hypothetical protein
MNTPAAIVALALTTLQVDAPMAEGWHQLARESVDDRLIYALALERAGVGADDASVLYGTQSAYLDRHGDLRDRAGIGWTRLNGDAVLVPDLNAGDTRRLRCEKLRGHDQVPGERELISLTGRPRVDTTRPEATGGPEIVLATTGSRRAGNVSELAIVVVEEGETVQVTNIHNRRSGHREELIEYDRRASGQQMVLFRDGQSVTACFQGTPPEEREDSVSRLRASRRDQSAE